MSWSPDACLPCYIPEKQKPDDNKLLLQCLPIVTCGWAYTLFLRLPWVYGLGGLLFYSLGEGREAFNTVHFNEDKVSITGMRTLGSLLGLCDLQWAHISNSCVIAFCCCARVELTSFPGPLFFPPPMECWPWSNVKKNKRSRSKIRVLLSGLKAC